MVFVYLALVIGADVFMAIVHHGPPCCDSAHQVRESVKLEILPVLDVLLAVFTISLIKLGRSGLGEFISFVWCKISCSYQNILLQRKSVDDLIC